MCLNSRVALLTGAGGGIGSAIAKKLAEMGADVILFGGNNIANLEKTANSVSSLGKKAEIIAGDLTDINFIEQGFIPRIKYLDVVDKVYFNEQNK